MFSNVVHATAQQAAKINTKYIQSGALIKDTIKVSQDTEDSLYFISCKGFITTKKEGFFTSKQGYYFSISYQVRNNGRMPCFFSLSLENARYDIMDIDESNTEMYQTLKELSIEAIQAWKKGSEL